MPRVVPPTFALLVSGVAIAAAEPQAGDDLAPTMQHTLSLKLVDKGFSNIEPGAGFMVVYAAKHGETAIDGADSPFSTALAHEIKEPKGREDFHRPGDGRDP